MPLCLVAFGSNLGDRESIYQEALVRVREASWALEFRASPVYETEPVDLPGAPDFWNAVWSFETSLSALELLERLLGLEQEAGRVRGAQKESRALDLDLLFYDRQIISKSCLTVPHPRFRERAFVLGPLRDVAPTFVDPQTGLTIETLWEELPQTEKNKITKLEKQPETL